MIQLGRVMGGWVGGGVRGGGVVNIPTTFIQLTCGWINWLSCSTLSRSICVCFQMEILLSSCDFDPSSFGCLFKHLKLKKCPRFFHFWPVWSRNGLVLKIKTGEYLKWSHLITVGRLVCPVHYLGAYRHPMPRHTAMFNNFPGTFDQWNTRNSVVFTQEYHLKS